MPRVTFETYRSRHQHLYKIWTENQELFSYISAAKQWEIHGYYLSSDDLSDEELRQHFQAVPIYDASQPNRAGKAYSELMEQIEIRQKLAALAPVETPRTPRRRGDASDVSIRVVVKPHVDINELSKIYLAWADDVIRKRRTGEELTDQT